MRKKFLKLRSKRQLLEVVFNGQNNICAYTKNIPVDREDQSDQTLGTGKTHGIILSMYELYGLNLCPVTMDYVDLDGKAGSYWCSGCRDFHDIVVPKFILATNIQFSKRTRTGYVRVGGIPGKVHYVETMGELALLAAKERMEYPDREVLCVIDEFPGFLDHLHSQDTEARELRDLLDLTRKLRICFLGIGPIYDDFVIHFRKRAPFHLFKDPLRVEQLRGTSNYVSDPELREKMAKASVKNTMFVKGKVGSKWIDTVVWVKSCPWTKFPPPVGGFCYETEAFAPFSMGEEFSKNFRSLLEELRPISTFERKKVARISYDFLKDYYSESAVRDRKRKKRSSGSAKSDMKAAIRHVIRTYYHPKWAGESDTEVLEGLERKRVVRSVACDRDGGNQSRATSYHFKSVSQLCRDLRISRTVFDNEMRKFRERYFHK